MRIGIASLILHTNYGGNLQAWALQTILERMGHQVTVFGLKEKKHPIWLMPLVWTKRAICKYLFNNKIDIFTEKTTYKKLNRLYSKIYSFIRNNIHEKKLKSLDKIPKNEFDVIITGSDQVWRKEYINCQWHPNDVADAFLSKIRDIKKIAYAASIGVDRWEYTDDETKRISKALRDYKAISVRELSAIQLLKDHIGLTALHTIDPTLLLRSDEYISLLHLTTDTSGGGLISYILDPNYRSQEVIRTVKDTTGLIHRELHIIDDLTPRLSIEEWVACFAGADFVVTDSFHGCIFSIIFRKPFICIGNNERGKARFDTLISDFNIEKNFIDDISQFNSSDDYSLPEASYKKLQELQNQSMNFLHNALGDN